MSHATPYPIQGQITSTPDVLTVERYLPGRDTPGNVGLCFSGGGTFALLSALGQMRALRHLGLLGKARAISSVSGGSWATVPFAYLPDNISDDDFLGGFVEEPGELTLNPFHSNHAAVLEYLPRHNLGRVPSSLEVTYLGIIAELSTLAAAQCPVDRLWSHFIGDHVLAPFGLASFEHHLPRDFFAYDKAHAQAILAANPDLPDRYYTYHQRPGDTPRPLHVCNFGQYLQADPRWGNSGGRERMAPVQSTAFYTGIWGQGLGTDPAGNPVGGGVAPSFAYNGTLEWRDGDRFGGHQLAPMSLSDITGASSAFFTDYVNAKTPIIGDSIDPRFRIWSPDAQPPTGVMSRHADGGCMDNNGVASLLAFTDIEKLVVFINSPQDPMGKYGDSIYVDYSLPTLFGLQPLDKDATSPRYETFESVRIDPSDPARFFQHNHVLDRSRFEEVNEGLWSGGDQEQPTAYFQREVAVRDNPWYGVKAHGRAIDILWIKTGSVERWRQQLRGGVRRHVHSNFPNLDKARIHCPSVEANLLAHLTSWVVAQQAEHLAAMFR